ncbi:MULTISPECIES: hypothetical protein [Bizionia]|uniref:Uncharacterized protein n=1 Tax=Bizionia algoritergicola TaxID=291187 RepID=A0A5D0QTS2_9FLAO|nr:MULTISPECIES: hypothetical protein [Bizionia]OBX21096.1 hypothetical protein BAA08_14005 [Bizionia sp. APA-3]TYB72259.1 hypothetical protein ES675_10850 [Bizionia algoritergicola]
MDLNTIIIGLVITTVIIVPLVYIQMSQNIQKKKAKNKFIADAKSKNVHVSEMDFWGTFYAVALDASENKLVYSKKTDEETVWITADLSRVTDCYIHKTDRTIKNKTTNKIETDRIDLVLRTKGQEDYILEFFNVDVNFEITKEKVLLEKWQALISKQLVAATIAA